MTRRTSRLSPISSLLVLPLSDAARERDGAAGASPDRLPLLRLVAAVLVALLALGAAGSLLTLH
jgi:hypothetical protein